MTSILILLLLASIAWFWMNSVRAKEIALQASANACKEIHAQFLDQTASLKSLKLIRTENGRMGFQRVYRFNFSLDRDSRLDGYVEINGYKINKVFLDEDDSATILK